MEKRKLNRTDKVREYVDSVIERIPDKTMRKEAFVHLYGVSQACAMIAMRRKQDTELAVIAGMLHDIWTYSKMDSREHAHKGAGMVREILESMNIFEEKEIEIVCQIGRASCRERVY